jgi:tRNA(Ile)-lysidine synthase
MSLQARFASHLASLDVGWSRAIVAVSGGPDSIALLDLLLGCRTGMEVIVAHVDHGISSQSGEVARGVQQAAAGAGVEFVSTRLRLGEGAGETEAREARYRWLHATRSDHGADWIVTAHHADDQAETVLLRVLGGSGPAGLAAMRAKDGVLLRPLLPFHRAELAAHVAERGLWSWNDPANTDPRHLRSWLRTVVLPSLQQRIPDLHARLLDVAAQAADDRRAWDELLDEFEALAWQRSAEGTSLHAASLGALADPLGRAVAMAFVRRAGGVIGLRHADRLLRFARSSSSGERLDLPGGWRVERAFDRVLLSPSAPVSLPDPAVLAGDTGSLEWGGWRLDWRQEAAPGRQSRDAMTAWFIPDRFTVRGWRAGDRLTPIGGVGRRLAVRCFQDSRVPRARRSEWPVVAREDLPIWIPGVCRSAELIPAPGAPAVRVDVTAR